MRIDLAEIPVDMGGHDVSLSPDYIRRQVERLIQRQAALGLPYDVREEVDGGSDQCVRCRRNLSFGWIFGHPIQVTSQLAHIGGMWVAVDGPCPGTP